MPFFKGSQILARHAPLGILDTPLRLPVLELRCNSRLPSGELERRQLRPMDKKKGDGQT